MGGGSSPGGTSAHALRALSRSGLLILAILMFAAPVVAAQTNSTDSYPSPAVPPWLNTGSNAWMLTAATLVGLMSIPGLAIYYSGLTRKKFALNTLMMTFYGFAAVMVVWVLTGYNLGFGAASISISYNGVNYGVIGSIGSVAPGLTEGSRALVGPMQVALNIPTSSLVWFQFVFAAITPLLFIGAIIERMSFKAWLVIVPAWSLFVYSMLAYWLFAGGWLNQLGAVDFSGGYVIHLAAGVAALAAAIAVGPRAVGKRNVRPNNLVFVLIGTSLLWLGWMGFNGGDPYGSSIDASVAVMNTCLAAATSVIAWMCMDMKKFGKASLVGVCTGAITGCVAITPAAGYVSGWGALIIGIFSGTIPWLALYKLMPRLKLDDALGVFPGHGVAGLVGGLLTGVLADPSISKFVDPGLTGAAFGNFYELEIQAFAAAVTAVYTFGVTFAIFKVVGKFIPLRETEATLKVGDLAIHGEVAYPEEEEGETVSVPPA